MRIILTGSTGFLGSWLANHWINKGIEICLLLRPTSNTNRIKSILKSVRIERISDVTESEKIVRDFNPDGVVHTACTYGRSGESYLSILDGNVRLGISLIQGLLSGNCKSVFFLNAGTVLPSNLNIYALSKSQFSTWGNIIARENKNRLKFIDLFLQQMYGPGDDRSKFTTNVIETCRLGEKNLSLTYGEQIRDFIHVYDVVLAFDIILNRHKELRSNEIIEIGSGNPVTIRKFVEIVHRLTSSATVLDFGKVPYRQFEPMTCVADTSRLRSLGWKPKFDLESGIRQVIIDSHHSPSLPFKAIKE